MLFVTLLFSILVANAFGFQTCPTGFINKALGRCYKLSTVKANFNDATTECENLSAKLLVIDDDAEKDAIHGIYNGASYFVFNGARYDETSGQWMNVHDNTEFPFEFESGYPTATDNNQCTALTNYVFKNALCDGTKQYICEAGEIVCGAGWTMVEDGSGLQCIKAFKKKRRTFAGAQQDCKDMGGDLATAVVSKEERKAAAGGKKMRGHYWIGVHDEIGGDRTFTFLDGTSPGSNPPFQKGRPGASVSKSCVSMKKRRWFDKRCTKYQFYICQKPAAAED